MASRNHLLSSKTYHHRNVRVNYCTFLWSRVGLIKLRNVDQSDGASLVVLQFHLLYSTSSVGYA
jgi:hypothetical protein